MIFLSLFRLQEAGRHVRRVISLLKKTWEFANEVEKLFEKEEMGRGFTKITNYELRIVKNPQQSA
jgi:hypothetical protein